jgi:hypothetical protein
MRKSKISASTLIALLIFSLISSAKERQGAEVVVTKKDGTRVWGELIAVKKVSLLLLTPEPIGNTDLTVALQEIQEVRIIKKSRFWNGLGFGLLIGGGGGAVAGFASGDDPPGFMSFKASEKAAIFAVALGGIGMIVGGIGGGLSGIDQSISIGEVTKDNMEPILSSLAGSARLKDKIY